VDTVAVEAHFDRPIAIRPERLPGADAQPLDRCGRRMPIWIAQPGRDDGHAGPDGIEERLGARRPGSVVGDLQEIDLRKTAREEFGVDLLLDVAGEQESPPADLSEQHDRDVVDRAPAVGRAERHAPRVGPEHAKPDVVERQPVTRRERCVWRTAVGKERRHRGIARAGPDHARLVDPADPIAAQEDGKARHVVLVRMREHERIDPVVPGGESLVEGDQEAARVGAAVHEHPTAAPAFDEDRVALADIEHDDPGGSVRMVADREGQCDRRSRERDQANASSALLGTGGSDICLAPTLIAAGSGSGQGRRCRRCPLLAGNVPSAEATPKSSNEKDRDARRKCGDDVPRGREGHARERH